MKPREEDSDQFLVLACDGVWDVMSNEDICNFIIHRMKVHDNLETICNEVIDTCLYKVSCKRDSHEYEQKQVWGERICTRQNYGRFCKN